MEQLRLSFVSRFCRFTVSFYIGSVGAIIFLITIQTAVFKHPGFWSWWKNAMRFDVFPVAIAELLRSPLMGLFFALLGARGLVRASVFKLVLGSGAFCYALAFFFVMLGNIPGEIAVLPGTSDLIEVSEIGLPIIVVLASRWFVAKNTTLGLI